MAQADPECLGERTKLRMIRLIGIDVDGTLLDSEGRLPDENRGYLAFGWLTTGQLLSLPMIIAGVWLLIIAYRRNEPSGNYV